MKSIQLRSLRSGVAGLFSLLLASGLSKAQGQSSPWGIGSCHIHGRTVKDYQNWVPEMKEIKIPYVRSLMCHWGAVEPRKGEWNWKNVDEQWTYLNGLGFECGALLIGSTSWNKLDPHGHLPVNNIDGWSEYVGQLAGHFKGRIKYYEVWNEPPNFTGKDQTPADYAKLVRASYIAAKKADPDCLVGLTAKSAHIQYLEEVIKAGAADHFDWISLHPYECLDGIVSDNGLELVYLNIVPTVRRMLAATNPAKKDVPITFTELGVNAERHGPEKQAHALVKAYVMGIAQGVKNIQWFEGRDGDSGPLGLLDRRRNKRPAWYAYGRLIEHLGLQPKYLGWVVFEKQGLAFVFEKESEICAVAWTPLGRTSDWKSPQVKAMDLTTGQELKGPLKIGTSPVLLSGLPEQMGANARANAGKLPPWPGDPGNYAKADLVEIDFAKDIPERGLHTRSGDRISDAIVEYGGSARAGDAPGGSVFVVDPAFLCYDRIPIEITVEVRRKNPKKNAGFKLVYESPKGFSTAGGWKTIPADDKWHTITWKIDDPMFVNYWGYHFRLESDGNTFNQYLLRKIQVRKLK